MIKVYDLGILLALISAPNNEEMQPNINCLDSIFLQENIYFFYMSECNNEHRSQFM